MKTLREMLSIDADSWPAATYNSQNCQSKRVNVCSKLPNTSKQLSHYFYLPLNLKIEVLQKHFSSSKANLHQVNIQSSGVKVIAAVIFHLTEARLKFPKITRKDDLISFDHILSSSHPAVSFRPFLTCLQPFSWMLNREFSLRGPEPADMSLSLTFLVLPGVIRIEFLSLQSGRKMLEYLSIRPSKQSPSGSHQSAQGLGKCQRWAAHTASYQIACGAKNLCEGQGTSALTGIPQTDSGNVVERMKIPKCHQEQHLLLHVDKNVSLKWSHIRVC